MNRGPTQKMREDRQRAGASMRRRLEFAHRVKDPVRIDRVRSHGGLLINEVDPETRALIDAFQAQQKKEKAK